MPQRVSEMSGTVFRDEEAMFLPRVVILTKDLESHPAVPDGVR